MEITTIFDNARFLARIDADELSNDSLLGIFNSSIYQRICSLRLWKWREMKGNIYTVAPYTTGTVAVANGSKTITFTTGVVSLLWTGRWFRVENNWYEIDTVTAAHVAANACLLKEVYAETTNAVATFTIFQDTYSLPTGMEKLTWLTQKLSPRKLCYIPYKDYEEDMPKRTSFETPRQYTDFADKIIFIQLPSAAIQFECKGWKVVDALDLVTNVTPEIPESFHYILENMLAALIKSRNDDPSWKDNESIAAVGLKVMIRQDEDNYDYIEYLKSHDGSNSFRENPNMRVSAEWPKV